MNLRVLLVIFSCAVSILTGYVIANSKAAPEAGKGKGQVVIGLSMDTLKEERWQSDRDLFVKKAKELGAADVLVQSANSDDTRQIQDIEALISRNVDVIVIVPHDGLAMAKGVKLAHQAGIPVIAYDRLIRDCDLDLYMAFDNVRVGEAQANYLVDHLPTPGKGKIVRIYGSKTDNNAFLFKEGQDNILKPLIERGDIEVLHEDWAQNWKPEEAKKIAQAAITQHGSDFAAILASNDGTAGGAIQALMEDGLAGKILVTGQDADLSACQRIVLGAQAMTIYKPIQTLASRAAEVAFQMASRKPIIARDAINNGSIDVPSVLLDVYAVSKDNMIETVIKDGFQKYDEVYRDVPENERPARP